MRLTALRPALPAELAALLSLLAQLDPPVQNTRTLLFVPAHALAKSIRGLPVDVLGSLVVRDEGLKALQKEARKAEAPPFVQGGAAYDDELERRRRRAGLTVGVEQVDRLLAGMSGCVEISGPEGSGKTLLALHLAIRHLLASDRTRVLWVDAEGAFSAERALAILQAVSPASDLDSALERLEVPAIFDLGSFAQTLGRVAADLASAASRADGGPEPSDLLIVVDPVTELYAASLASVSLEAKATMVSHLSKLSAIAQGHSVNVLLLNSSVPSTSSTLSRLPSTRAKPALGSDFTFLTDATLWVEEWGGAGRASGGRQVVVQVGKNKTGPSGGLAAFQSDGVSLEPVPT